jgi:Mn2+/Fe2+ NRAMP family transporter
VVWLLIVKGSYRTVEKVFLVACVVYIAYPIAAFMAGPHWGEVLLASVKPTIQADGGFIMTMIGLVGTTIAPWMQFYQQSSVVEKGITPEQYGFTRLDVIIGCIMAIVVAFFIVVACATTIHPSGVKIKTAADAAVALKPLVGRHASAIFAFGLFNASLFAACILPLSTAYYICEGLGWESGVDKDFDEAPQFFWLFTAIIAISAIAILVPSAPLLKIMFLSQVVNGAVLPFVLIFILLLVNDRRLMGDRINGPVFNGIAWLTVVVMIVLTAAMTLDMVWPGSLTSLLASLKF